MREMQITALEERMAEQHDGVPPATTTTKRPSTNNTAVLERSREQQQTARSAFLTHFYTSLRGRRRRPAAPIHEIGRLLFGISAFSFSRGWRGKPTRCFFFYVCFELKTLFFFRFRAQPASPQQIPAAPAASLPPTPCTLQETMYVATST